jgi:predicted nucleotide-binding protein (sugar kinase/HSP70/actin superfamily)
MNKQKSLSSLEDELSQVRTKKKEFLEQIKRMGSNDKAVLLQSRAREYAIRPEINRTAYFRSHEVFRGDI